MLDKIFNRKYIKAIKEINDEIEYLNGREDYYHNELQIGGAYCEIKEAIERIDEIHQRKWALIQLRHTLKQNLH